MKKGYRYMVWAAALGAGLLALSLCLLPGGRYRPPKAPASGSTSIAAGPGEAAPARPGLRIRTETGRSLRLPPCRVYEDPALAPGQERILAPGRPGLLLTRTRVTEWEEGVCRREVLDTLVLREPCPRVVARGPRWAIRPQKEGPDHRVEKNPDTIGPKAIITASGRVYPYSRKLSVSATAYSCGSVPGRTCTGTRARVGAIAVDPRVIPLGTKMYIVSEDGAYAYGLCVAEDIGGGIRGRKVDLYFNTLAECWDFGVRDCTVYILEEP